MIVITNRLYNVNTYQYIIVHRQSSESIVYPYCLQVIIKNNTLSKHLVFRIQIIIILLNINIISHTNTSKADGNVNFVNLMIDFNF